MSDLPREMLLDNGDLLRIDLVNIFDEQVVSIEIEDDDAGVGNGALVLTPWQAVELANALFTAFRQWSNREVDE